MLQLFSSGHFPSFGQMKRFDLTFDVSFKNMNLESLMLRHSNKSIKNNNP